MIVWWLLGVGVVVIVGILIVQEWQFRKRWEREGELASYCLHRLLENGEAVKYRMSGPIRIGEQRGNCSGDRLL